MLACVLGCLRQKKYEFHCLIIDRVTLLHISAIPLSARGSYNYEKLMCSSRVVELSNAAEILQTVALEKRQGTDPVSQEIRSGTIPIRADCIC